MKIKFLGTAAAEGWPGLFCTCEACMKARNLGGKNIRTRSSCLIDDKYMIDFPPDTYMHILNNDLHLANLSHLIITHSHQDHFYPQDLMMRRPVFAHIHDRQTLHLYGNDKVRERFAAVVGSEHLDNILEYHEIPPYEELKIGEAVVTPLLANHNKRERCYIYIFESNGKKLLYGHDSGYFPEDTWTYMENHYFDGVILDCTSGPIKEGTNHMGLPDDIEVKDRLLKQKSADRNTKFIITHFSHNGGILHEEMIELAKPHGFEVAFDGAEMYI